MRILRFPVLVVSAALALGGCGSPDAAPPAVASISQAPAPASSASAKAVSGPQARLDTSQEEIDQWNKVYWKCLSDHGAPIVQEARQKAPGFVDASKATAAQLQACAAKKPNGVVPELDPDQNPDYAADFHEDVKCLQREGMPIVETADGWTWTSSDAVIPKNRDELELKCQIEAFTKH